MNVVPHMMIVNTAAKCPIILLLSVMSASFAYAGKNSVIRTGTDSDKLVKIMREMALVKKIRFDRRHLRAVFLFPIIFLLH